ncbi:MAG: hypothetical protein NVS4B5_04520 [Vulcanimicrobiaceae bacterium]
MNSEMSAATRELEPIIVAPSDEERRRAVDSAVAYLKQDLSDRYRVLGIELRIDKPSKIDGQPARLLGVFIVDYTKRRTLEALVDAHGKIVSVNDLHGFRISYTSEELEEARAIAAQDRRVAHLAGRRDVFASEYGPESDPKNARLVGLRYATLRGDRPGPVIAHAVVDLSTREVRSFEDQRQGKD